MAQEVIIKDSLNVAEDISALYLNKKFSDLILNVGGEKLHVHRMILGARSEYFEALLYGSLVESTQVEIKITDASPDAFRKLLKYVYAGTMTIDPQNLSLTLEVIGLAHKYLFTVLLSSIIKKIVRILDLENIYSILNVANLYDLCDLRDACHRFMDVHASEVLQEDGFNDLTQTSVIKLLQRDSFFAPEIDIFKGVARWCKANNDDENVLKCVRLSWLSVAEIMSVVRQSNVVDNEVLLQAIAENVDVKSRKSLCRAQLLIDENIATPEHGAEVISVANVAFLLNGNRDVNRYATQKILGDKNGITIKLGNPMFVNHIQMMLYDTDTRYYYCYYIEVSIDQRKWKRVIDYRHYSCRSYQNLYFKEEIAQYIRVVGTHNSVNDAFHLLYFEAYYKTSILKTIRGIVCPTTNIATVDKKAIVIEGINPAILLNGDTKNYDNTKGYTTHSGSGAIVVQLAQPYMISSIKLLLWDKSPIFYHYYIESSLNKTDWEVIVDRRNEECSSWQICRFKERPVVFIRVRGSHTLNNENVLRCVHFECPAPASDVE